MKVIIQKFGGTSLADADHRNLALKKIQSARDSGYAVVVVVSAMGRHGSPYATDTLKNLIGLQRTVQNPKNMDLLLSCGEIISAVVLSDLLESSGCPSTALTGWQAGIVTDDQFGNADILSIEKERLSSYLERDVTPVVTGFQGINARQEITTLGRGGSDTTAVALGAALKAEQVEIYTDVDGIMTADPRVVTNACILDEIHYDEIFQMADLGAKIIHPRAVEIARQNQVILRIRNVSSEHPGTLVHACRHHFDTAYRTSRQEDLLTAITQKDHLAQVVMHSDGEDPAKTQFFQEMADEGISIDMINFSPDRYQFVLDDMHLPSLQRLLSHRSFVYETRQEVSKVTIIGNRITGIPGVMASVIRALTQVEIPLLQSTDSHTTISCLVDSASAAKAVQALHQEFRLDRRQGS